MHSIEVFSLSIIAFFKPLFVVSSLLGAINFTLKLYMVAALISLSYTKVYSLLLSSEALYISGTVEPSIAIATSSVFSIT